MQKPCPVSTVPHESSVEDAAHPERMSSRLACSVPGAPWTHSLDCF